MRISEHAQDFGPFVLGIAMLVVGTFAVLRVSLMPAPIVAYENHGGSGTPIVIVDFPESMIVETRVPPTPAPTPRPRFATPAFTPLPTLAPLICGENAVVGESCLIPTSTPIPPTPLPDCEIRMATPTQVITEIKCVWTQS